MQPPVLLELFAGTGSVGESYLRRGWQVVSLDISPCFQPTHCCDLRDWDYTCYPPGHFTAVHASPPCTQYSVARTTAKTPRDLEGADRLVEKVLDIIRYFNPLVFTIENPWTGLLKTRPCMEVLLPLMRKVTYCAYEDPPIFKKATSIWSNLTWWRPRPPCSRSDPCASVAVHGRHEFTAQRGPGRAGGSRRGGDRFDLADLYRIPTALCDELSASAHVAYLQSTWREREGAEV